MNIGLGGLGLGNFAEDLCDSIGLPEEVGDIAGGAVDLYTGNYAGAIEHGLDLFEEVPGMDDLAQLYAQARATGLIGPAGAPTGEEYLQQLLLQNLAG